MAITTGTIGVGGGGIKNPQQASSSNKPKAIDVTPQKVSVVTIKK